MAWTFVLTFIADKHLLPNNATAGQRYCSLLDDSQLAMQESVSGRGAGGIGWVSWLWVGFVALECVNVVMATAGDAIKCETDNGEHTELKDEHLKTNGGNTTITLRTRVARRAGGSGALAQLEVRRKWRKNEYRK